MKRIHYPTVTIDLPDDIAEMLFEVGFEAAEAAYFRSRPISNGVMSEPYAIGQTVPVSLIGYVNGGTTDTQISVVVGAGIPLAISDVDLDLPEPEGSNISRDALTQLVERYTDTSS